MKRVLIVMAVVALWCGLISVGLSDDVSAAGKPNHSAAAWFHTQAQTASPELLLAMAPEASNKAARTQQTERRNQTTRLQQGMGGTQGQGAGQNAAWGGPGRGAGAGRGAGFGAGGGRGAGRGFGPGAGRGLAPGGPNFVDNDNDGICDHYQQRRGSNR